MSDEIVWEDLPKTKREKTTGKWLAVLAQVAARPGEWARIREYATSNQATSAAGHLRAGALKRPPGEWEFAARKVDGHFYLYARFLSPSKPKLQVTA